MRRRVRVAGEAATGAPQQRRRPGRIAAEQVGPAHGELGEPLPEVALGLRRRLPAGLQDLVGVERHPGVEQPLGLGERREGRQHQVVRHPGHADGPPGQWPSEPVPRPRVARPPLLVPLPLRRHVPILPLRRPPVSPVRRPAPVLLSLSKGSDRRRPR
ncbi:MAG: hypothetical protein AVDCRST_MAG48-2229 [uncultured Friedmanniella sp.]|uniref:Uncharacterized protein n=1 Tax=uncultured Friedmanniella sp. TaxID=335381 RepID=A0A6J4KTA3_9ACTN|nr:MAG: hypothetical protein AVDCRST_MAG48-2229 [uncultured Friedmanniella sp.]